MASKPAYYVIAILILLGTGVWAYTQYLDRHNTTDLPLTPEAKLYTRNLQLSDVEIKAKENYFQQAVVEIHDGKIANYRPPPARHRRNLLRLPRPLRPTSPPPPPVNRKQRPKTRRNQILPPPLRRPPAKLEPVHAPVSNRRRQIFLMLRVLLVDDDAPALEYRK